MNTMISQVIPPDSFYYVLSTLFGLALIWFIVYFVTSTHKTQSKLADAVVDLKQMLAIHDLHHKNHEKEIKEIRSKVFK